MIKQFKKRVLDPNAPVEIYRNLNRKNLSYSIRQRGKVIAHANEFSLRNARFIVNKAGRKRVIDTKHKNVHAYIKGFVAPVELPTNSSQIFSVKYNPYLYETFVKKPMYGCSITPIKEAKKVYIKDHLVLAFNR